MADGCDFVCCSKAHNVPAAYRGVGNDQQQLTTDEISMEVGVPERVSVWHG